MFSCVAQKKITTNDLLSITEKDLMEIDSLNKINVYYYDKVNTTNVKSITTFGKLIWSRKKNGEINFNKKNLKTIAREYVKGNDKFFSSLELYLIYLIYVYNSNHQNYLSFAERAYIGGHITENLYNCKHKANEPLNSSIASRFIHNLKNHKNRFNREFENYNYYGLKFLKKYYLQEYSPNDNDFYYKKHIKREGRPSKPNRVF